MTSSPSSPDTRKRIRSRSSAGIFDAAQFRAAAIASVRRLSPVRLVRNPVMFVTEMGALVSTAALLDHATRRSGEFAFSLGVVIVLWATILFANFSEALAEARGRAQAEGLKRTRKSTIARRLNGQGSEAVLSEALRPGDLVAVEAGEIIPGDGEVVEGAAAVDESAITGESAPVIREAGTDRSGVTGGTRVLSDRIVIRITAGPGESFLDRMIGLVEGATRQKTPNELALTVTLAGLTLVFLLVTGALAPLSRAFGLAVPIPVLVSLLVCLIPTTIGALLPAIGLAGLDRAVAANVMAKSGKAVELAGDIDTLLLDKTGTITIGDRQAAEFLAIPGIDISELIEASVLASLGDPTPEGRSILRLGNQIRNTPAPRLPVDSTILTFSAHLRLSGLDLADGSSFRKGAADAIEADVRRRGGFIPSSLKESIDEIARDGRTPIAVSSGPRILGAVSLADVVKPGIRDRFLRLRAMGLRVIMVTGDNPLTAAAVADEAGVDGYLAEAKPEDKLDLIRREQGAGHLVAMMGDGTNDAPALAQADIGLAMNSGTQAAKEAGNMVDLDNDPTKLVEVIEIGKQLLITRGALTTFSVANDMAKYFAIIPAIFRLAIPGLGILNVMGLASPQSAVFSALVFNALVIPALIPLALKGVRFRPGSGASLLRRNLLIYGLGGLVAPFVGIKLIDAVLTAAGIFSRG